jgi:ESS family glutamate:Na+ symporter
VKVDPTLQAPLMVAFFTTIGFAASVSLLKEGGAAVATFFAASTAVAVAQNVLGLVAARALGQAPLLGVLAGSVTLTGGPATGLAFAPLFESAGIAGAGPVAITAAMVGIVGGGLVGGPLGTALVQRARGPLATALPHRPQPVAAHVVENRLREPALTGPEGEDVESFGLLRAVVLMLAAMWVGSGVSAAFAAVHVTLPAYIGGMLVAAVLRNLDDATGWLGVSQRTLDDIGGVALALFLTLALMTLRLWEIVALALPLAVILLVQIAAIVVIAALVVFRLMGRDYDAAVMSSGFCGFMLGTTANAMANMDALVERFGPSPKAFLVVPMVGAFFIDFTNALIITAFVNLWR